MSSLQRVVERLRHWRAPYSPPTSPTTTLTGWAVFTSSSPQKTTASRSPSPHLTLNLGRAAGLTTWRYRTITAVFVRVVAADGAANIVVVVEVVVVVVGGGGDNNSKDDDDDDGDDDDNNKGDLLRSLITLEIGISKRLTLTIKQGQKEDRITNCMWWELSPFANLVGSMFVREPSWKYSANLVGS